MTKLFPAFLLLAAGVMAFGHYVVFVMVPMEASMGAAQRIFYYHVPAAMFCYLGFIVCFAGSLWYLWSRKAKADALALTGAEVGLVFGIIVLTTGPLWARAAWGVWWKWEPRLTSMALLILIFAAYWVLRSFGGRGEGVRRFAAVLAVFGTPNIIFVNQAVKRWRGDHPTGPARTLSPEMQLGFNMGMLALFLVFILLLVVRYRTHRDALTLGAIRRRLGRIGALR